jgi:hypothetical protein
MRNNRHYRGHSALAACTAGILGAVLATSAKAQNLLLDPGFEPDATTGAPNASAGDVPMSTAGPWLGWNNWVSPYSAYYTASVAPHSGTQVGKTFSGPNAGIYQFVNITAGNSYTASAWFDDDASDPFNDTAMTDDVRMIFFSGTGGTGTNLGTFVTTNPLVYADPLSTWLQSSVTTTAPVGAESVQWMAFLNNPNYGAGSLFVDDASLVDNTIAVPVWNGGGADSNWSTGGNWGGTAPTSPVALTFGGTTRLTNTNNMAADTVFGGIQFNSTAGAFVLGGNAIGLSGDVVNNSASGQTVNIGLVLQQNTHLNAAAGNITVGGAISGGFSVTASGSHVVTLDGSDSYSGGTTVSGATLVIGAAGALPANSNVSITSGALQLGANTGGETLSTLTIASGGSFDVNNNHFLLSYAAGTQAAADAAIRGYLVDGYNGGAWNGTTGGGLDSSAAASNSGFALGYADGADGVVAGLSSGQIEVKYTLYGDANLDGVVSGDDFTILVGNLGKSVTAWDQGDFNYDGVVSGDDFTLLVGNLGKAANGADITRPASDLAAIDAFAAANGLMADVPEPASVGLIAVACVGALGRRRRLSK